MAEVTDIRDLRDPQAIGQALMDAMQPHGHFSPDGPELVNRFQSASRAYDFLFCWGFPGNAPLEVPNYDSMESLGSITAATYLAELTEREADGDKFAASMMAYYRKHGTLLGAETEPVTE